MFAISLPLHRYSPGWCKVVHARGTPAVTKAQISKGKSNRNRAASVRASISFPVEVYRSLEVLARQNKVSLAWVVRDAAEKYVAAKTAAPGSGAPGSGESS